MSTWLTWAAFPVLAAALWMYTLQMSRSMPTLEGKRIALLIAHPDDEAMFFAPTLQALTRPELGNHVKILCLSSGDADGLGETRKQELLKSGMLLGLRSEDDMLVIEDSKFPDSMTATWPAKDVSALLAKAFAPDMGATPATRAPDATIDAIVTFDAGGVSGHPNHRSLYHGAHAFLRHLMQRHAGWDCPVKLYTLTTVNVARKYASVLDAPATVLRVLWERGRMGGMGKKGEKGSASFPSPLMFVSGVGEVRNAQGAMVKAHKSQMVWFRWGWIGIGRYMVINDLRREKVG
ncbi:n-acetylglucosaminyl-phosphatidylinositol de-n-acetylase [Diplodia corticola]|uniref:N-acetylglucosaminylphosphatidylinositol deacetylase n=1 Tax=Diplodia corticola TaxID=236234 RepID=A0A1J9QQE1_9PEZI|nr:n-acetylglucosaminyl-phosphatidylinositol de-n-acetylase [Diplodia corticola]OJD30673.1 n-acetylglucosaminyl-phosphatidylinositol de-n-acetylase [Diplodia corticola]